MADVVISASQVIAAGQGYTVPAAQEITVRAVRASFNGAAAAGSYVPTLQIVGDSGIITAECPAGATLAAGASADVSWFPGVKAAAASGTGGGGIMFDTFPQSGGFLSVTTTSGNIDLAASDTIDIDGASGVLVQASGNNGVQLETAGAGDMLFTMAGTSSLQILATAASGHYVIIKTLPTVNPGIPGALWNSSGAVMIS